MIRPLALLLPAFVLAAALAGAPLERDLGQRLAYVRVKHLPADLPSQAEGKAPPLVVDVRYVEADSMAATTFAAWVRFRAAPQAPVFVLANAATSAVLLDALAQHGPGCLTIGIPGGRFRPDSAVAAESGDERRAYDALEQGTAVEALLADFPDKVRNDEASLARGQPGAGETPADPLPENPAPRRGAPLIDAALQRAVHLHRALVALKKL